ncbi:hypothetical protein [Mucilaginibacter psychrotolerans]|uniref:Uncharacterized protein n=1 Tax=Mucilaginibacter psychrotolerans TaxID=1524096 RepID=A0A4Y8S6A5_9SPHI|nr:hypothetical protein [Mucilaginibacter psychrotolerans]TFF34553.1 hypothetical protein E2R66_21635 [Mucilaginibacter psychrotolerans]
MITQIRFRLLFLIILAASGNSWAFTRVKKNPPGVAATKHLKNKVEPKRSRAMTDTPLTRRPAPPANPLGRSITLPAADVIIHFNDKGQLTGELPQILPASKKLGFQVSGLKDPAVAYAQMLKDRATEAVKTLNLIIADANKEAFLQKLYEISDAQLKAVRDACIAIAANPTIAPSAPNDKYTLNITPNPNYYTVKLSPSSATPVSMPMNTTTGTQPSMLTNGNSMTITLSLENAYKKMVWDWYYNKKGDFKPLDPSDQTLWASLKQEEKKLLAEVNDLMTNKPARTYEKLKAYLETIKAERQKVQGLVGRIDAAVSSKLKNNQDWLLEWLWYQNTTTPQLNPFKFVATSSLGQEPDTSDNPGLRLKIQTRENVIKNMDTKNPNLTVSDHWVSDIDGFRKTLTANTLAYKNYQILSAANEKSKADFAQTTTNLNEALFFVTVEAPVKKVIWMRHHDAADGNEIMNVDQATEYLEDEKLVILTHNLATGEKSEVSLSYSDIKTNNSFIGDLFLEATSMINTSQFTHGGREQDPRINGIAALLDAEIGGLGDDVKNLKGLDVYLDYLLKQTNVEQEIQPVTDQAPVYHSEKQQAPQVSGNKAAAYTVKTVKTDAGSNAGGTAPSGVTTTTSTSAATTTTVTAAAAGKSASTMPVDTFKFRVNKKYRIFPMAGIAFNTSNFTNVAPGSDGNSPGKQTSESISHFFVGIKVFIEKTDIRNTRFFLNSDAEGNSLFWSRTHFDAAFEIGSPLNNLYFGGGFDLWPGFGLNVGCVLNKYNYNLYANGQNTVSQSLYRPGVYLGVSTDVAVVAELFKLLNIGK